jgi:DNA-binding MarR family transcriptional regulator
MTPASPVSLWQAITSQALAPGQPDLTNRQTAILLSVHTEAGPHTVRGLADRHGLGKPAVVRALDTLSHAGLLKRVPDPADRRSVLVEPTEAGAHLIADMSAAIALFLARSMRAAASPQASAGADEPQAQADGPARRTG